MTENPGDHSRFERVATTGIGLPLAGPGGRSYAFIIDWHIRVVAALLCIVAAFAFRIVRGASVGTASGWLALYGPALCVFLLYHPFVELVMTGQTPGKRIAGVRVVTRTGQAPSIPAILIRNAFRLVDSLPAFYTVGLLTTIVTRDSVRFGDLAAGTLLVYTRDRIEASRSTGQR
jgi:uncharacterized RDD family membrane protein YckC